MLTGCAVWVWTTIGRFPSFCIRYFSITVFAAAMSVPLSLRIRLGGNPKLAKSWRKRVIAASTVTNFLLGRA